MLHPRILQFLTWSWYAKDLFTRIRYHIMGNPNEELLFNSGLSHSQGDYLPFNVSSACENHTVYRADEVFVTHVDWRKRYTSPYHEFLVIHVSERKSGDQPPRKSVITIDRCVGKRKDPAMEPDSCDSVSNPTIEPNANTTHNAIILDFMQDDKPTSSPYVPAVPKDIPTFLRSSQSIQAWSSSSSQRPAEDAMLFSLDGTEAFVSKLQRDHHVCRRLTLNGEFVSVQELAFLARTVHEYHQSYDLWCYQCYWFADTIYNMIKMLVDKKSISPLQYSPYNQPYFDKDQDAHIPAGFFKWSSSMVKVTQKNPQMQAVIYDRYTAALDSMNSFLAERKRKHQGELEATKGKLVEERAEKQAIVKKLTDVQAAAQEMLAKEQAEKQAAVKKLTDVQAAAQEMLAKEQAEKQAAVKKLAKVQAAADKEIRKLKEELERISLQSTPGPSTRLLPATRFT